ncbi:hypothetical protein R1flu_022503 [Riccia fluitans]|uniref:E3 ubiquitin-protein ligase RNF170 n=1 Tax=Riccia fluitans TaxID=41844 RepID=A0ABD1XSD7_9MARC
MPYIEGVGDELVYAALVAAPVVFICRSSLGHPLNWLKHGAFLVRKWVVGVWNSLRGERGDRDFPEAARGYVRHMEAPPANECCAICHDNYTLPVQANCAHWFCGECILRVWQHTSALQPCKCPICRRPINLFIPSEPDPNVQNQGPPNADMIMRDIAKYNRIFGGQSVGIFQRVRDMPLLLRRLVRDLMDPQRAIQLIQRTPILFYLLFLAFYVFSPLDIIPEGIVGVVGLLDDLLVLVIMLFYLAMLYRSTLLLHHGGHGA